MVELERLYKNEVAEEGQTGAPAKKKEWPYMDLMEQLSGYKVNVRPHLTMAAGTSSETSSESNRGSRERPSTMHKPRTSKQKKDEAILQFLGVLAKKYS